MMVGTVCLQEMGVVIVVSLPFTVSLFAFAMIDHSDFTNLHSKCTSPTVILLPLCTSVLVEHGERFGVQHAIHGCESGQKAFV